MLEGNLVRFRAYTKNDLELARAYFNDQDTGHFVRPGFFFPFRPEDEEKWYESINPNSEKDYTFAIELKSTGTFIGGCGIYHISVKNHHATLGILLGKAHCGCGYGTDALKLLVDFCFLEANLHKVKLRVMSYNQRAIRCYEKVAFVVEGVMKEEFYRFGRYHDDIAMGLLRADWEQRQARPE